MLCHSSKGKAAHLIFPPCNSYSPFLPLLSFITCLYNSIDHHNLFCYATTEREGWLYIYRARSFKFDWQPGRKTELCTLSKCCLTCGCFAVLTIAQYTIWSASPVSHVHAEGRRGGRRKEESKIKAHFNVSTDKWGLPVIWQAATWVCSACLYFSSFWLNATLGSRTSWTVVLITHIVDMGVTFLS